MEKNVIKIVIVHAQKASTIIITINVVMMLMFVPGIHIMKNQVKKVVVI